MHCKLGETIQELAARIRQDAVICDFPRIKDPIDEALHTRFMCSVGKEAILKALFKVNDEELTFAKAIAIAVESEETAKVARETVYGSEESQPSETNPVSRQTESGTKTRSRFPLWYLRLLWEE